MADSYDDVMAAILAIRDRLEAVPPPSSTDQKALEAEWDRLFKVRSALAADSLAAAAEAVAQATGELRAVVDSAKTDPVESFIAQVEAASRKVVQAVSDAQSPAPAVAANPAQPAAPGGAPAAGRSTLQDATIKAILNVFETGLVRGDYADITLIKGDTGGLTYGRSQTTLNSGGLAALVQDYCADTTRPFAPHLQQYLPQLTAKDAALNSDVHLQNLLRATADYQVMRDIQDVFFDRFYWTPALAEAAKLGVRTALGLMVVYDGFVHGSFDLIRDRTDRATGNLATVGEKTWISQYVDNREQWLADNARDDLHATVYRTQAMRLLIGSSLWDLPLPLVIRGLTVSTDSLSAFPQRVFDGPKPKTRDLMLANTVLAGQDVRLVQVRLTAHDIAETIKADALFGPATRQAIQRYQGKAGLASTGIVDNTTFEKLGF